MFIPSDATAAWPSCAQLAGLQGHCDPYPFPPHQKPFPAASSVPNRWGTCPYSTHSQMHAKSGSQGLK